MNPASLSRRTRRFTALLALVSLLFMQMAVAGYVCPGSTGAGSKSYEAVKLSMAGMPCADMMATNPDDSQLQQPNQPNQPNLCRAHCQSGQQSADKYEMPSPVHFTALPANFTLPLIDSVFSGASLQAPALKRTTAPPLAVLHCCLRL